MEENKINYGLIMFLVIIAILFIPIIFDYVKKQNIEVLSINQVNEKLNNNESMLVYIGEVDNNTKKELRKIRELTRNDYSYDYGVYNVEKSKDVSEFFGEKVVAVMYQEGDVQKTYEKYDEKTLTNDVNRFLLAKITEDNASYKVAENFNAYKKAFKSNDTIVTVFGRTSCGHCNRFKPVYNAVAEKYNLDIYYFDSDVYNKEQYKKVINLDLTVPAKCSSTGKEFKLSDGFGTPLSIITKKGKVIDCIGGYVNRASLIKILKANKMISE